MVAIGNPIRGPLHEYGWQRPAGNTDMRVTQTAAQHMSSAVHPAGPPALDIGDGNPDLDDILCPHAGVVAQALTVGSANLSIDFTSGGQKWRIVLAHDTLPHPVAVAQAVSEGQVVGRMGMTGATAIHLHIQLGYWNGSAWVWVDPWPYLRQNGATEEEEDVLQGTNPRSLENRKVATTGTGVAFRSSPFVKADNVLARLPVGQELHPDYIVDGTAVGAASDKRWYGAWATTPSGIAFGYISATVASEPAPIEQLQSGHTDQELADAAKKGAHAAAVDVSQAGVTASLKYPG